MRLKILVFDTGHIVCDYVLDTQYQNKIYPINIPKVMAVNTWADGPTKPNVDQITLIPVLEFRRFGEDIFIFFEENLWCDPVNEKFCNFAFNMIEMVIRNAKYPGELEELLYQLSISTEYYSRENKSILNRISRSKKKVEVCPETNFRDYVRIVEI